MNNKRRKSNRITKNKQRKVIRCKNKMIPVFDGDICEDFIQKEKSDPNHNCKNCKHSF